jgi:hypothetical protein
MYTNLLNSHWLETFRIELFSDYQHVHTKHSFDYLIEYLEKSRNYDKQTYFENAPLPKFDSNSYLSIVAMCFMSEIYFILLS